MKSGMPICLSAPEKRMLRNAYQSGWSYAQLAKRFLMGETTIRRILKDLGVRSRDPRLHVRHISHQAALDRLLARPRA